MLMEIRECHFTWHITSVRGQKVIRKIDYVKRPVSISSAKYSIFVIKSSQIILEIRLPLHMPVLVYMTCHMRIRFIICRFGTIKPFLLLSAYMTNNCLFCCIYSLVIYPHQADLFLWGIMF